MFAPTSVHTEGTSARRVPTKATGAFGYATSLSYSTGPTMAVAAALVRHGLLQSQ